MRAALIRVASELYFLWAKKQAPKSLYEEDTKYKNNNKTMTYGVKISCESIIKSN
jgi:hypothetical protein